MISNFELNAVNELHMDLSNKPLACIWNNSIYQRMLLHAINFNYTHTIGILLSYGVNPNGTYASGYSPIHLAVICEHQDSINKLLEHGGNLDQPSLGKLETPLHMAAANDLVTIAKLLISFKCKLDCQDMNGNTALHMAVKNMEHDMVELLLDSGASPVIQNTCNQIALDCIDLEQDRDLILYNNISYATQMWRIRAEKRKRYYTNVYTIGLFSIAMVVIAVFF